MTRIESQNRNKNLTKTPLWVSFWLSEEGCCIGCLTRVCLFVLLYVMHISASQSTTCALPGCLSRTTEVSLQQSCWDQRTLESLLAFLHAKSFSLFASDAWVERTAEPLPRVKLCGGIAAEIKYSHHSQHYIPSYKDIPSNTLSHLPFTRKKNKQTWGIQSWI